MLPASPSPQAGEGSRASTFLARFSSIAMSRRSGVRRTLGEPIDALRGAAVQLCLLVGREIRGQAFETVPQNRVARTHPVRRKIALEHASIGPERRDAGFDVGLVVL